MATLCIEGFGGFVASTAAPIATGWSDQVAGRDLHPLKIRAFSRRTRKYTVSPCLPSATYAQGACFIGFMVKNHRLQKRASF